MLKVQRLHSAVVALICCFVASLNAKTANVSKQKEGVKTTKGAVPQTNHTVLPKKNPAAPHADGVWIVSSKPALQEKPQKMTTQVDLETSRKKAVQTFQEQKRQLDAEKQAEERRFWEMENERVKNPVSFSWPYKGLEGIQEETQSRRKTVSEQKRTFGIDHHRR